MGDTRFEAVRPVIPQDAVVGGFGEGDVRDGREGGCAPCLGQAVGEEVVGHAAVRSLGLGCPFHIAPEIGRLAFEDGEVIVFCYFREVIEIQELETWAKKKKKKQNRRAGWLVISITRGCVTYDDCNETTTTTMTRKGKRNPYG